MTGIFLVSGMDISEMSLTHFFLIHSFPFDQFLHSILIVTLDSVLSFPNLPPPLFIFCLAIIIASLEVYLL